MDNFLKKMFSAQKSKPAHPPNEIQIMAENDPEQLRNHLKEIDAYVVKTGLERLEKYFHEVPPEKFPDTVIFIDASARPLVYAVKPLLDKMAKDLGRSLPTYRFLPAGDEDELSHQVTALRAKEIKKEAGAKNILLIDDTVFNGITLEQIRLAFKLSTSDSNVNLTFFAFFLFELGGADTDAWRQAGHEFIFGCSELRLNKVRDRFFPNLTLDYRGLSYRYGSTKSGNLHKLASIGVEKAPNSLDVARTPLADAVAMRQLREEMANLGKDFIKKTI